MSLHLSIMPGSYAISRLSPDEPLPDWISWSGAFVSVTRTADELSVLCPAEAVPAEVKAVRDWRAFKIEGPLDFAMTGVLSGLATPLAQAGITVFAISTYDTDYLLVREKDWRTAATLLGRTYQVNGI